MKEKINWSLMIESWESSGLSKQAFCIQHGLTYQSFLYHLKKREQINDSGTFQQVLVGSSFGPEKIDYFLCDGRCVSFPINTPKEVIRLILSL
jgi:hypothetical protein